MVKSLLNGAKGLAVVALLTVAVIFPSSASALNLSTTNTLAAQEVGPTGVTLRGQIGPTQPETLYWFEYGPTTAYGTKTPMKTLNTSELSFVKERINKEFTPGTTFHYRMFATDSENTDIGEDKTFVVHTFQAEKSPVHLIGNVAPGTRLRIGTKAGVFECDSAELDEAYLPFPATSFTVWPYLSKCHSGSDPAVGYIYPNKCKYKFNVDQGLAPTTGSIDMVNCSPEMTTNSAYICPGGVLGLPPQNLGPVTYSADGSSWKPGIVATLRDTNISYKCGTTTYNFGTLEATWRIYAWEGATPVGLFVK